MFVIIIQAGLADPHHLGMAGFGQKRRRHPAAIPFPPRADECRRCTRHRETLPPPRARRESATVRVPMLRQVPTPAARARATTSVDVCRHSRENRDGNGCRPATFRPSQRSCAPRGRRHVARRAEHGLARLQIEAARRGRNCLPGARAARSSAPVLARRLARLGANAGRQRLDQKIAEARQVRPSCARACRPGPAAR